MEQDERRDAARDRRRFLAGSALALVATAGCLQDLQGNGDPEPRDPDPNTAMVEHPRIDEPPYEIRPQTSDADEWNELYLCEYMPSGSDLEFEMVSAPRLTDPLLPSPEQTGEEYAVRVLESEEAVREVFDVERSGEGGADDDESPTETGDETKTEAGDGDESTGDGETEAEEDEENESTEDGGSEADGDGQPESREDGGIESDGEDDSGDEVPVDEIDFDEHVLLIIESGYGSGSIAHHWKRVETTDGGFRLHGCHAIPSERTDDVTSRHSVVRVERREDFEFARVSLTTTEDERVHFNSTEGIVAIEKNV